MDQRKKKNNEKKRKTRIDNGSKSNTIRVQQAEPMDFLEDVPQEEGKIIKN